MTVVSFSCRRVDTGSQVSPQAHLEELKLSLPPSSLCFEAFLCCREATVFDVATTVSWDYCRIVCVCMKGWLWSILITKRENGIREIEREREKERERERERAVMNFILHLSIIGWVHITSSNYFHQADSKVNWSVWTLSCGCDVFQLHQSKAQSESNSELLLALLQDSPVSLPIYCTVQV